MDKKESVGTPLFDKKYRVPFFLVTSLFFLWGVPNNLNGILMAQFMKAFELSAFQAGLVQSSFYLGYFALAIPSAMVMRKYSYKSGLITGLLLFALGCTLFLPAAHIGSYGFFLFSLFVIASGLTFLETGANSFIVQMGEKDSAEQRLNLAQAFNPIGSISGILIGTIFIFSGVELDDAAVTTMKDSGEYATYIKSEILRTVMPYLALAAVALVIAIVLWRSKLPEDETSNLDERLSSEESMVSSFPRLLKNSRYMKGVLAQFLYVGAQVGTWSYFIKYVQDYTDSPEKLAGYLLTGTLFAFAVGRFSASWIMKRVEATKLMALYAVINVLLVGISIYMTNNIGMWSLFLTSFFMSLMYPTIFSLSVKSVGSDAKAASSLLVMAIIGGALMTPLMGYIADLTGSVAISLFLPLICYCYIACYSWGK